MYIRKKIDMHRIERRPVLLEERLHLHVPRRMRRTCGRVGGTAWRLQPAACSLQHETEAHSSLGRLRSARNLLQLGRAKDHGATQSRNCMWCE
jgi:hypothetical protein